jgi:4-hydroxy-tetrahydrodipicolinate synthase
VKYVQHLQGLSMYEPRRPMMRVSDEQKRVIKAAMQPLMA